MPPPQPPPPPPDCHSEQCCTTQRSNRRYPISLKSDLSSSAAWVHVHDSHPLIYSIHSILLTFIFLKPPIYQIYRRSQEWHLMATFHSFLKSNRNELCISVWHLWPHAGLFHGLVTSRGLRLALTAGGLSAFVLR